MENENAFEQSEIVEIEAAARRRRLIKFAAIAGGALVGLVVLGKLASSNDETELSEDED